MSIEEEFNRRKGILHSLRAAYLRSNLFENLERFATGALFWCLRRKLEDRRLEQVINQHGARSFECRRQRHLCNLADTACRFSQPINTHLKAVIEGNRFRCVPDRDIRLLVANQILKRDGDYEPSIWEERAVLAAGVSFSALCVVGFSGIAALIWLSMASVILKASLTTICLAVLFVIGYSMSCYAVKPYFLVKRIQ